jgi:hypothetical protein
MNENQKANPRLSLILDRHSRSTWSGNSKKLKLGQCVAIWKDKDDWGKNSIITLFLESKFLHWHGIEVVFLSSVFHCQFLSYGISKIHFPGPGQCNAALKLVMISTPLVTSLKWSQVIRALKRQVQIPGTAQCFLSIVLRKWLLVIYFLVSYFCKHSSRFPILLTYGHGHKA